MSGGIRSSVKGYIKAKPITLTSDTIALQSETENETIHSSLPQAAERVVIQEASTASNALSIISRIPRLPMPSFALCFKGTKDHEGIQIASGFYSPSIMQKIVFKVDFPNQMGIKILKMLSSVDGVDSLSLDRKDKKVTIIGQHVDTVYVVVKLRKYWYTEVISISTGSETRTVSLIKTDEALSETTTVEPVEEGKKDEGRKVSDVIINPNKRPLSRSASI